MLKIDSVTLRRGPTPLLEETNALIHSEQRVAIIGANGAGKTSLFKLILGELTPDSGNVSLPGNCRVSHMAQEVSAGERLAIDYVLDGHQELRRLEQQLQQAEQEENHDQMAEYHGELEGLGAYLAPITAEKLLHGLGFTQQQLRLPVYDFSGGWRIRLNLAQALMRPSDLLLLDEPTNHLDLDAILWLEQWLKRYRGTVLFISHDRDFIDAVSTHILHFEHQQLNQYTGTYSKFEIERAQKLAQQQAQHEKQQQRINDIQAFVTRFKAKASKAKQAQSRMKELARMEIISAAHVDSPFHFQFPSAKKISNPLLNIQKSNFGYEGKTIIQQFSTSILPGTRIGLLGPNGAGKSTLVKSLVGGLSAISGERTEGEHLSIGYFAQHQLEALDLSASAFLHLQRLSPTTTEPEIRKFLGGFDFRGDEALKTIDGFSGGEKARLALAIIAWQRPNLLILDEPTNHLDLEMRHALTLALQSFQGAILIVSHDRHLLKNTIDTFWLVADGKVKEFEGDLHDYELWLKKHHSSIKSKESEAKNKGGKAISENRVTKRKQLNSLKNKLTKIESELSKHQEKLNTIEQKLTDSSLYLSENNIKLTTLLGQLAEQKKSVETTEIRWFEMSEEIEKTELT